MLAQKIEKISFVCYRRSANKLAYMLAKVYSHTCPIPIKLLSYFVKKERAFAPVIFCKFIFHVWRNRKHCLLIMKS